MQKDKALVVGGSNGIGLAMVGELAREYKSVVVIDKNPPAFQLPDNADFYQFDLTSDDYSLFDKHDDASLVFISAGFGRLALFEDIKEEDIALYFGVNTIPVMRIAKRFYYKLLDKNSDFYFGVMVSISGFMSSPFFSVYAATKAALKVFIESVNVELEKSGSSNVILNVSPGSVKGTNFDGKQSQDLSESSALCKDILKNLYAKNDLFIPKYNEVFRNVLERYHTDFRAEGRHSYDYKLQSGRMK